MDRDPPIASSSSAWSRLLRRTAILLAVWFLVGPVLGIVLVEPLNQLTLAGIPLGFWISQQGSIYVFVVLIFIYAWMGDRLDRETPGLAPAAGGPATVRDDHPGDGRGSGPTPSGPATGPSPSGPPSAGRGG